MRELNSSSLPRGDLVREIGSISQNALHRGYHHSYTLNLLNMPFLHHVTRFVELTSVHTFAPELLFIPSKFGEHGLVRRPCWQRPGEQAIHSLKGNAFCFGQEEIDEHDRAEH